MHNCNVTSNRSESLLALALRWGRDSFRARGLWASLKYLCEQFWQLVQDSTPQRRRSRFGDIDYDCDFGIDTTWARLSLSVRLREIFTERLYQPTVPDEFSEIMQHVEALDLSKFTFIDLGSGKGRVLFLASSYPFRQVIGVEVQRELHEIACCNIENVEIPGRQCGEMRSLCMDGREFEFPVTPLFLYLFNPFPDYVLKIVLENLQESLQRHPRPAWVVYNTPWEKHVFENAPLLDLRIETPQYQIYCAKS